MFTACFHLLSVQIALCVKKQCSDLSQKKGHIVAVHTGEVFVMDPAVNAVGQPLHGGEIVVHGLPRCAGFERMIA